MKIGSAFPSTYLKAADLQGRHCAAVMSRVMMEEIGGEHKPVLYFDGHERGIVLNKTNSSIIADMHGDETDDWTGKRIVLYPARVEFQGKIVDAIRVKLEAVQPVATQPVANGFGHAAAQPAPNGFGHASPPPAAARQAPAPAPRQMPTIGDDEIPF